MITIFQGWGLEGLGNGDNDYYEYSFIETEAIIEGSDNYVALFHHTERSDFVNDLFEEF